MARGKKNAAADALEGAIAVETVSPQYTQLLKVFRLRPIRSEEELDTATGLANVLSLRKDLTDDEQDYLDVLCGLIEGYEDKHYPVGAVPPARMLQSLMEDRGITQAKLAGATGLSASTVSEILSGKRGMGRTHVEAFAKFFEISPSVFFS